MNSQSSLKPRFRRQQASASSLHRSGLLMTAMLLALTIAGVASQTATILLFAVGAGAGYALSGSV